MNRDSVFGATLETYLEPVHALRDDPAVTEIMINGVDEVYVERNGKVERANMKFQDPALLEAMARNLAQFTNQRITDLTARFDSRLPDGSRVHVVMPRCSRKGLCISIRQFSPQGFSLEGLVDSGTITPEVKEYIEIIVLLEQNFIVSGGTGTGKTSFLNAISQKIPATQRIIVIEDVSELQLKQPHVLSFETISADRRGRGAVTVRDLFHSALRMRPDRIVIGECRGGEALDLIQAMTSGHGGSMSTLHASTSIDALKRLETMAMMSGLGIPLAALRAQIASAIGVVIQLARTAEGERIVTEIAEVENELSAGEFQFNVIFKSRDHSGKGTAQAARLVRTTSSSIFADRFREKGLMEIAKLTRPIFAGR